MGWLGSDGVVPITGARWSAGAFWAEAVDSYKTKVLALTPSSHWGLGEASSSFNDAVAAINGTAAGSPTRGVAGAVAPDDLACQFNGSSAYISFGDNYRLAGSTNSFTILAWVKWATNGNTNTVISKHGNGGGWRLNIAGGNLIGIISNSTNATHNTATATGAITAGVWHHVAFVVNASNLLLYVDGVEVASAARTVTIVGNADTMVIGKRGAFSQDYFEGVIDEVSIFASTALTGGQIAALLEAGEDVSVWEDEDDWPHTDNPLTLNIFVGGYPMHEDATSASWGLGQEDIWAAPAVSSASISMRAHGIIGYPSMGITSGDRVVILTEDETLWYGYVETVTRSKAVGASTGFSVDVTISCADDLSLAARGELSTTAPIMRPLPLLQWAMRLANINLPITLVHPMPDDEVAPVWGGDIPLTSVLAAIGGVPVQGSALAVLGEVSNAINAAVVVSPDGVRVWKRTMTVENDNDLPDLSGDAQTIEVDRDQTRAINQWDSSEGGTYSSDPESVERHGLSSRIIPVNWYLPSGISGISEALYARVAGFYLQNTPANVSPPREMRTKEPPHLVTIDWPNPYSALDLQPLDLISVNAEGWQLQLHTVLVTSITHNVTPDGWSARATAVVPAIEDE